MDPAILRERKRQIEARPDDTVLPPGRSSSAGSIVRRGWVLVLVGFCGFFAWTAWAPLDSGIVVEGQVKVNGLRKVVQLATEGVVAEIAVAEGQSVEQGQVLLRLDTDIARAQYLAARARYFTAIVERERARAERQGAVPDFEVAFASAGISQADVSSPALQKIARVQQQLYRSNVSAQANTERELVMQRQNSAQQVASLQALLQAQKARRTALSKRLKDVKVLQKKGYVARHDLLILEDNLSAVDAEIASAQVSLAAEQGVYHDTALRLQQSKVNYAKNLDGALVELELRIATEHEQSLAARHGLEFSEVRAPVAGTVVNLRIATRGAVLSKGSELLDIVPSQRRIQVHAQLPIDRVDSVHSGQRVDLMFTAFNQSTAPRLPGEVVMISADSLSDGRGHSDYYAVHIDALNDELKASGLQVQPGMPVQVFLRGGELTLLTYLLKPLLDRLPGTWSD